MDHPKTNSKRKVEDDAKYDFVDFHGQCCLRRATETNTKRNVTDNASYGCVHCPGQS